jgi:polyhydroxybutyrate depolymerase
MIHPIPPLLLISGLLSGCVSDTRCPADLSGCHEVEGGRYLVLEPAGWDGQSDLPMLLYFHPYNGSDDSARSRGWLKDELDARGILGVFPNGIRGTWAHVGSPSSARDELAFLDAVLADVEARWPVAGRLASGFSQGGSMAWDAACYRGDRFDAFLPIAGSFWEPLPETCPAGPVNLRHTHGLSDGTVPMEGRPIGQMQQGDVLEGMAIWRAVDGCAEEPDRTETVGVSTCQIWSSCGSAHELSLCLHDGAHEIPTGWVSESLDWANAWIGSN